jgi:hypothetical protein
MDGRDKKLPILDRSAHVVTVSSRGSLRLCRPCTSADEPIIVGAGDISDQDTYQTGVWEERLDVNDERMRGSVSTPYQLDLPCSYSVDLGSIASTRPKDRSDVKKLGISQHHITTTTTTPNNTITGSDTRIKKKQGIFKVGWAATL